MTDAQATEMARQEISPAVLQQPVVHFTPASMELSGIQLGVDGSVTRVRVVGVLYIHNEQVRFRVISVTGNGEDRTQESGPLVENAINKFLSRRFGNLRAQQITLGDGVIVVEGVT